MAPSQKTRLYRRPPHPKEDRRTNPRGGVHAPALRPSAGARPPHSRARRRARRTHSAVRSAQSRSARSSAGTGALTSPQHTGGRYPHYTGEFHSGRHITDVRRRAHRAQKMHTACASHEPLHVHIVCTSHVRLMCTSHLHLVCTSHVHLMCTHSTCITCAPPMHIARAPHVHIARALCAHRRCISHVHHRCT